MLISFTGAKVHVHVCGKTGAMSTHVEFANISHEEQSHSCCDQREVQPSDAQSHSCCSQKEQEPTCCGEVSHANGDLHDGSCCLDIQKELVTDKDYNPTFNSISFSPAVLDLAHVADRGTISQKIPAGSFSEALFMDWSWPPLQSRTVLLL